MTLLLALIAAAAYGISDFAGGLAARRFAALEVIRLAYPCSALLVLLAAPFAGGSINGQAALLAAGTGLALGIAVWSFYLALAQAPMGVVAPVTSVLAAGLPVLLGVMRGESIPPLALAGIGLALLAIVLISRQDAPLQEGDHSRTAPASPAAPYHVRISAKVWLLVVVTGVAFALSFVLLHAMPKGAGLWPVALARVVGSVLAWSMPRPRNAATHGQDRRLWQFALGIGLLDALANSSTYYALQGAQLASTSVVVSLYPVFTVIPAVAILREHINRVQWLGMALALVAIVLITLGG